MKPLACRILDFKSIVDTNFTFSADRITVLAGQNESGKTSVLSALRDFDLSEGKPPETADYIPDSKSTKAATFVCIQFEIGKEELDDILASEKPLPQKVYDTLLKEGSVYLLRALKTGTFTFYAHFLKLFPSDTKSESDAATDLLTAREFANILRNEAPSFVYFDSFADELPREVSVQAVLAPGVSSTARTTAFEVLPQPVKDFFVLADLDIHHMASLVDDDRRLGNYLSERAAKITGHFLSYWKQRSEDSETIRLRAQHHRSSSGQLSLSFYVNDGFDQHPDQRSRGFLWFLSFFLRLTSAQVDSSGRECLILIDEPGSFLHPKAQRDVLTLLENWICKKHWVVYSTHSPYLLPPDKLYRVRLVAKQKGKGTYVADKLTDSRVRGEGFSDALSPVLGSIGMDVAESLITSRPYSLIVEGISDLLYIHAWIQLLGHPIQGKLSVFPGTGASSVPALASLLIGWGVRFCALLDRDPNGDAAADKLFKEMGLSKELIIRIDGGVAIEDLFSSAEFKRVIEAMDKSLVVDLKLSPAKNIAKLKIDKILVARAFATATQAGTLTVSDFSEASKNRVSGLLSKIVEVTDQDSIQLAASLPDLK